MILCDNLNHTIIIYINVKKSKNCGLFVIIFGLLNSLKMMSVCLHYFYLFFIKVYGVS